MTISRYEVLQTESMVDFEVKSSLHPVRGSASNVAGYVDADFVGGTLVTDPPPAMHLEVPVERMRSGNDLQDREMWKMIDSRRFPLIRADLRSIADHSGGDRYKASGDITLAGRQRSYDGALAVSRVGERLLVEGALTLDIRDFGLRPPRILMIRVEPEVTVRLRLFAASKN